MSKKRIPGTEFEILPLGLGGNTFGGKTDARASEEVLDAFVAGGGNFIDTADQYAYWVPGNQGGESETILGEWMRKRGHKGRVIIATKVGGHPARKGLAPENIRAAAEDSLRRLQTETIDLYYAHFDDLSQPIEGIAASFDALVRAGKVRHVAISNLAPERIEGWMKVARENGLAVPVALQPEYHLLHRRKYEEEIAPLAERHGLGVFPYFSLARGFLTGKYRKPEDLRGRGGALASYLEEGGLRVIEAMDEIAKERGAALASIALAWLLAKPTVTAPLASATSVAQLEELLASTRLPLTPEEIARLDAASSNF